ncbi:MAG: hypothetical protein J5850_01625 [Clostridia bacterium]|nr:hypothetical protein [Clostridia bacterium]
MELNIKYVEELARIINDFELTGLEVTQGDSVIKLKKEAPQIQGGLQLPLIHTAQTSGTTAFAANGQGRTSADFRHITEMKALRDELASAKESLAKKGNDEPKQTVRKKEKATGTGEALVKAPVAGIFYRQSQPGNPPYAVQGQRVKKGETLCLVEAMKMINEVAACCDGVIKEFLVENEDFVEYDRPLVVITEE